MRELFFGTIMAIALTACTPPHKTVQRPTEPKAADKPESADDPHAKGLRPPTAEERAAMDQTMTVTGEVRPNRLGLERINAERAKQGLPPLKIEPAPDGSEAAGPRQK